MTDETSKDQFVIQEEILSEVQKTLNSGRSNAELARELHIVVGGFGQFSVNLGVQMDMAEANLFGAHSPVIVMEATQHPMRPMVEELMKIEHVPEQTGRNRHEIRRDKALARTGKKYPRYRIGS